MSTYHITPEANTEIMRHMRDWSRYIDADLLRDWHAGIGFLFDFGIISLKQYGELREMFPEPEPEPELRDVLRGYRRMIERDEGKHPSVVLDDIAKSIAHVLRAGGVTGGCID